MKRLSMFLLGIVFIGLAAFATQFNPLPNYPSFIELEVEGQSTMPINIKRGEDLKITATFEARYQMNSARLRCYLTTAGVTIELTDINMNLLNASFPVSAGQRLNVQIELPIYSYFPLMEGMKLDLMIDDHLFSPIAGASLDCCIVENL